jgi:hypothetical protein
MVCDPFEEEHEIQAGSMLFQRICLFEWLLNPSPPKKLPKSPSVQQEFVW